MSLLNVTGEIINNIEIYLKTEVLYCVISNVLLRVIYSAFCNHSSLFTKGSGWKVTIFTQFSNFSCQSRDSWTQCLQHKHLCYTEASECQVHNCSCQRQETNMESGFFIVSKYHYVTTFNRKSHIFLIYLCKKKSDEVENFFFTAKSQIWTQDCCWRSGKKECCGTKLLVITGVLSTLFHSVNR